MEMCDDANFPHRPTKPSLSRIEAQPCLRSIVWVLSRVDYGSAGCQPREARTPASSTSLLKVSLRRSEGEGAIVMVIASRPSLHTTPAYTSILWVKFFLMSSQSPPFPRLLPDCWKGGVNSCSWCQWTPTEETAPLSPPSSSTSLWRTESLGPPS